MSASEKLCEGRVALVTGANSGIGEPTARELGRAGARVLIACRSADKAEAALGRLRQAAPQGDFSFLHLDLADLSSIKACAQRFGAQEDRLDLLVNNAGVMIPPYSKTKDGFELQFGTNHLGHFALTAHLLDQVVAMSPGGSRDLRQKNASLQEELEQVRLDWVVLLVDDA